MLLPYLKEVQNPSKKYTVAFKGINYGEGTQDGEFAETYNLTTDSYPCITQRGARIKAGEYENPSSLHAKGELLVIDGTKVLYGGEEVGTVTEGKKQIATIGKYIVIFPDKMYYDTEDGIFADMQGVHTAANFTIHHNEILVPSGSNLRFSFQAGDIVSVENSESIVPGRKVARIKEVAPDGTYMLFDDSTFWDADMEEKLGGIDENTITIARAGKIPDLDFICESNYRLWGTHGNTIHSSEYSHPFNFESFEGLTGDSYYIDVGSEGEFTGCIPFSSHICFFKEHTLHKIYGTKPSNFQLNTVNIPGVQSGSERSMRIINEQLFYKGINGIYVYTGGVPELISEKFGNKRFTDAVACSDSEKYYISMKQGDTWGLYVYDTQRNIWLREDNTQAVDMTLYNGKVYYINSEGELYYIDRAEEEPNIEWSATFCTINETINERKVYSKFHLRLDLSDNSWIAVDMKTNDDFVWKQIYSTHNERAKTVSIPIMPTRCDSIDIRLRGKGKCVVKTFVRELMTGSDV